ncbi:4385_t:CDS:2 [Cetraspora pellucida]|uniref:4385_t:CDS:1 n=1 Tax=Cetraspora pellucida TaxID=1433469 RepID=A0ACA9M5N4_9GLOM|nr:4385_t:CDS:2 [Cetraspora pellucida]
MLETEINCNTLTTNGIYNSLLKNKYFNKLVKFNIDEINAIHIQIEEQKEELQKSCDIDFLIDKFSTNNRFENFMDGESLKNNQLFTPEHSSIFLDDLIFEREIRKDYINNDGPIQLLIKSTNISEDAKKIFNDRRLRILSEEGIPEPEISLPSNKFDNLKKEIENIDLSDISKLTDEDLDDMDNDISSNKFLSEEQKNNLLSSIQQKKNEIQQNSEFDFLSKKISEETDIDKLKSELKNAIIKSSLNETQKKELENIRLEKIKKLESIKPPSTFSFDELKEKIEDIKLSNVDEILDDNNIHQKITNSNLPKDDIDKLEKLRKEKLNKLIKEQYNKFENSIFLTPESLDKFFKENIDTLDKNYLTSNRKKNLLNEAYNSKRNLLIESFTKEENSKYESLLEDIKNCEDSYLLSSEYYNDIYRNIEDLDEKYFLNENTKSKLHEIREQKKNTLEIED